MALLDVKNLNVRFATPDGEVHAVKDLSFSIEREETLGVVGESGSGKSQAMLSLIGLLADNGAASGCAIFDGQDLLSMTASQRRALRGRRVSMIFQDPMTSLNPFVSIGAQMSEVVRAHESVSAKGARARCVEMLEAVQIPEASARLERYPHELSGGMRQRVMIAASLLLDPELLIADEPTTALDVTVQAQILELLRELRRRFSTAIIMITHDLGVIAGLADRVLVMQDGVLREQGPVADIFYRPEDAYTRSLLRAVPRLDEDGDGRFATPGGAEAANVRNLEAETRFDEAAEPLLKVSQLGVHFRVGRSAFGQKHVLKAVDGVSLELRPGETLGVVGESGCGKSTLARAVLNLVPASEGSVSVLGHELAALDEEVMRGLRKDLQVVFQDPLASLNPRMTVGDIVSEPLWTHRPALDRGEVRATVADVLRRVGLTGRELNRYPHEFSGGQCQRIGIARALVLRPKLIVCDEPVSALDVSIQAQIIDLIMDLRREFGISLVFIAHDLAVVRHISHRVMVMYLGSVMEVASRGRLYAAPSHPYTQALIGSVPIPDPDAERRREHYVLSGELPSPIDPPSGCRFRTRCRHATERCAREVPLLREFREGLVACHRAEELAAASKA